MRRVLLALVLALSACGHTGHGGSGFGHFGGGGGGGHFSASSSSHVASGHLSSSQLGHRSHSSSSELEHVARAALPIAEAVGEALVSSPGDDDDDAPPQPNAPATETSGPLIDDHDPCNRCPDDMMCGECSFGGNACVFAPAGAHARCATPR